MEDPEQPYDLEPDYGLDENTKEFNEAPPAKEEKKEEFVIEEKPKPKLSPKKNPIAHVDPEILKPSHVTHPDLEINAPLENVVANLGGGDSPT